MIVEYHRPESLENALALLARDELLTVPLAGGSALNRASSLPLAVVDLQSLGLNTAQRRGNYLTLGAMFTLQNLLDYGQAHASQDRDLPPALIQAVRREASYNLRQVATVAGTLVAANGRSPFTTAMLALDAVLTLQPGNVEIGLGDILPVRDERLRGHLIVQVKFATNARLAYDSVARTPSDQPILCVALAVWPSGRTRLALGGFGRAPILAFDGSEASGIEIAARSACSSSGDQWASSAYRQDVVGVLALRALKQIQE
ncbi:MAG: FAD binding domain-containing protein [Anaerolineales bacterium]|nr:FAD binding domain-containing protein [Anaerolineales bacterium]